MLTLSKPKTTTYGLHSFSYFSAQRWNDTPDELMNCSFNDFKRRVQVSLCGYYDLLAREQHYFVFVARAVQPF